MLYCCSVDCIARGDLNLYKLKDLKGTPTIIKKLHASIVYTVYADDIAHVIVLVYVALQVATRCRAET